MNTTSPRALVHDRLATLADATRCRLLLALDGRELTVGELCQALQLPQSTVSRHLRVLADAGWTSSRAEGASRWYAISAQLDEHARDLWTLVSVSVADTPAAAQDAVRVHAVVSARRARSEAFFADAADRWDATRGSLFGDRSDLTAALALLDPTWTVGDLGCGTGTLSAALAPMVHQVISVDASPAMLEAARARTTSFANVDVRDGTLESLPLENASLDVAVLMLVLHHVAEPVRVLREARRVLRAGGRLLVCDMRPHEHEEYRQQMGHVWLGFDETVLNEWCAQAGFEALRYVHMSADASVQGPALFVATATAAARKNDC